MTMHVGIDDTDSPKRGCTTHVASLLIEELGKLGVSFIDYPNLARLNPNVPWKTRGNGALCLRFQCDNSQADEIQSVAIDITEQNSDLEYAGTEPGLVFYCGKTVPEELRSFAKRAIQGIVKKKDAMKLVKTVKAEAFGMKTGRGIIGALAAVGETLTEDHTYELIAYRKPSNCGTPRQIDKVSVFQMDKITRPYTFNNVDHETGRILITPHGPDPILYGIRGETASIVKQAHKIVQSKEPIERWTIFRTNHGTDAHLRRADSLRNVKPFNPVIVKGSVSKAPWIVPRRHVFFTISDDNASLYCAAYEPTGDLRKAAAQLLVGDVVEAHGGVRPASEGRPLTLNLEKLRLLLTVPKVATHNPLCSQCGKRLKSMGTNQGFRCEKCGFRSSRIKKLVVPEKRLLKNKIYVTSPRSQRHLTKPLCRYGLERTGKPTMMLSEWFVVAAREKQAR